MTAIPPKRGDEPSMFLQRPSTGKSQDVRHILVKTFRELFTRDAIGPDTVRNLAVSKGGDDEYHETYVQSLQKVFAERQRRMEEAAMLERHIMQAQARAMSADERELNRVADSCDTNNYHVLGLPPVRSHFRNCLDTQLLQKHNLLTPMDYATADPPPVAPPAVEKVPSYARDTLTSRQHTRDDMFLQPVASVLSNIDGSKSDIGSLVSEEPLHEQHKEPPIQGSFPRNDGWKQQLSEEQRQKERVSLQNLNAMTSYTRNPRHVPPSAPPGGKSLIKKKKSQPKEVGIQQKPPKSPEPSEHSQVFLVSPPAVVFTDYKIGQVYELTLTLKNVSACIRQCRALPASTTYFSIGLGQFPGEHGLVAPGMSCHYAIRFNPDSLRDFDDVIRIQTQSSEPIVVPLLGRRPPPNLTIPREIEVGYCLVGGCLVTQFVVKNKGGHGRFCLLPSSAWPTTNFKSVVRNGNVPIPPFDIRPSVLEIGAGQTGLMEIVFQPPAVKNYSVDVAMVCDNCNVQHFTIKGVAERASVELISVERGMSEADPGELNDATAQHLIKFDQLNPFTYTDRTAVVRNTTNVSLPFQWMIYKPQFDSPGGDSAARKYERVPDVDSVFSVHPPTGMLPPSEKMEFKLTYAPPVVDRFHSVLHLLLNMVPSSMDPGPPKTNAVTNGEPNRNGEEGNEEDISEIILPQNDVPPFADVTAMEIEVKGESTPLSVVLHPYSIHVPGKNLVGSSLKKMVTMANHSHSTITFQWEPYTEQYLLEVEPPFGELDPGMAMDMELAISGPEPCKIDHTLYCHVMNLEEPLHLQVQAEFKGPEISVDEPDLNFNLVKLGQTVKKQITVNNVSQIITPWAISAKPAGKENEILNELTFEPSGGNLRPLETLRVTVTFTPQAVRSFKSIIEVTVVPDGPARNISCWGEVQISKACLVQCEIQMPVVYKQVPVVATAMLLNQALLPTVFEWGQLCGEDAKDCSVEIDPLMGELAPRETKNITINFTANRIGEFSDLRIPCKVEGMDEKLVLALYCDCKGLSVRYHISQDGQQKLNLGTPRLDYGDCVPLNSAPKMYVHITNNTAIVAAYSLMVETFHAKPPSPPDLGKKNERTRNVSTRRLMLGKTPNLADPLSKTVAKAQADMSAAMLCQGTGVSFVLTPSSGFLSPFASETIEVTAYSDMWGVYKDNVICRVGDLDEIKIPVTMTVVGCPLSFQMTTGAPDLNPMLRFGTHVAGTAICQRTMRVRNNSPYDVRVDWKVFDLVEDDQKLLDFTVCFGNAFPIKDAQGHEIIPPTEAQHLAAIRSSVRSIVPQPVIRQSTDYIPDSADTSQNASREVTANVLNREGSSCSSDLSEVEDVKQRPKLVSVFCKPHEGQRSKAPYSIVPEQMVIPGKGYMNVVVSFTPHSTDQVSHDIDCNGYILGYMSLDNPKVVGEDGKVTRSQAFEASTLRLDMTAHLKPALLTIESSEEEGMRYRSAMSSLLNEDGNLKPENLHVASIMLSNLTLTALTFSLVTKQPFTLVELDPSSNDAGLTRAHCTTMHTLKPRHNLIVKVAFQTTCDLLTKLLQGQERDNGQDETEDVDKLGRKLDIKDDLTIQFNNGAEQLVPLYATLTVPQFELSKYNLNFGTCLVGQRRELQLIISNTTSSHTKWNVSQERQSKSCAADTFSMEPTCGFLEAHITHISDSKCLLQLFFTAKHAENYETVFVFRGVLGEMAKRLYVKARGSYDGKHEAVLNV